jgi:hypothetical protein
MPSDAGARPDGIFSLRTILGRRCTVLVNGMELTVDKATVALAAVLSDPKLGNLKAQDRLYKVVDRDGLYAVVDPGGAVTFRFDYVLTVSEKHSRSVAAVMMGWGSDFRRMIRNPDVISGLGN